MLEDVERSGFVMLTEQCTGSFAITGQRRLHQCAVFAWHVAVETLCIEQRKLAITGGLVAEHAGKAHQPL
ncbi:hypothetical protein D3C80_2007120 [compost metagenome]